MAKNSQSNGTEVIAEKKERKPRRPNPTPHKLIIRKIPNILGMTLYVARTESEVLAAMAYRESDMYMLELSVKDELFNSMRSKLFSAAYADSDIFTIAVSHKSVIDTIIDRSFIFELIQKDTQKASVTE